MANLDKISNYSVSNSGDYTNAMRSLCSGVCIVTSAFSGERYGITATAVCSISASPPTLLVSINRENALADIIRKSNSFAVNVLGEDQAELAKDFSIRLKGELRFSTATWENGFDNAPILPSSAAIFECSVIQQHAINSHLVFYGLVENVNSNENKPISLIYGNGEYGYQKQIR